MDLLNSFLNLVVPPATMVMVACAWPTLSFITACERIFRNFYSENMEEKVVIITGASSGIGEQIAYEYAKRGANLVLVARRENRLWGISENARRIGANHIMIIAADVVKEEDCRRFVEETVNYYGRVDHLVNTSSLGHTFSFEEATDTSVFPHMMGINFWGNVLPTYIALPYLRRSGGRIVVNASVESWLPMPRMSLYAAAKAAVVNFYETLRFELRNEVGITVATHGWIGSEMISGKLLIDEGAEMQWKEEREMSVTGDHVQKYAKWIVDGACRGDAYVKYPSWYDTFMVYRAFTPDILRWTFQLLLASDGSRRTTSYVGTGRVPTETTSPTKLLTPGPFAFAPPSPPRQFKTE
ncbi:11beta-hydroxysteroid dehydrogenase [Ranunculus cassubicifolius]